VSLGGIPLESLEINNFSTGHGLMEQAELAHRQGPARTAPVWPIPQPPTSTDATMAASA